jgi:hypothetical protein
MHSSAVRRTQVLASGLLIITFAVGCLVGAASDRVLSAREPAEASAAPAPKEHDARHDGKSHRHMIDAQLLNEIPLSSAQRLVIDSILDTREREAKKLWREWVPQFNAMMDKTRGQVRAQLTPDQAKQLDELIQQHEVQRKQNHDGDQQHNDSDDNKPEKQPAPSAPDEREAAPRARLQETVAVTL